MCDVAAIRDQAERLIKAGELHGALSVYDRASVRWPDDLNLAMDCGVMLWQCYEFQRAQSLFERHLGRPDVDDFFVKGVSRLYFQAGRYDEAAQAMSVLAQRKDVGEPTLTLYASALERAGDKAMAREILGRALAINPGSARACRLRAHLDKRDGDYELAVRDLEHHLEQYPSSEDWRLQYELGGVLDRMGHYSQAWEAMVHAKSQLACLATPHLQDSYLIRQRQWEVACQLTEKDFARWQRQAGALAPPMRMTIMAGFPRSGTTLLEQVLVGHQDCVGTDETGILGSQFITPLIWQAESAGRAVEELQAFDSEQLTAGRSAFRQATEQFIGEPIANRLLIEKEPLLTPDLALPLRLFPEATVLMPLRDPRDVVVSYFFTMVPLNWGSAASCDIVESVKFYADCMRHWLRLRDRLPIAWLEPRYEDLVRDPAGSTQSLVQFLGLEWDESIIDDRARSDRAAIRTPTYDDITKPITPRSVGRWHSYAEQLAPALDLLEPYLHALDYQV